MKNLARNSKIMLMKNPDLFSKFEDLQFLKMCIIDEQFKPFFQYSVFGS